MNLAYRRIADFSQAWHRFWCTPADPLVVSTMRWFVGGMLVYTLAVWSVDLEAFFLRDGGWQSEALTRELLKDSWSHSLWWLISDSAIWQFHLSCIAIVSLFWIGFMTPVTKWLALAIMVSYSNRVPLANYGLDQINSVLTLYLCLSPCGARLSLDSWLRNRYWPKRERLHASEFAGLAIRLIQVHFCIVYLWAGLSKLQGVSWWTGEAVWRAAANYEYQQVSLTWLAYVPWFVQLVSISTWAWELSFPFLIWSSKLRLPMLLVGLGMHVGIGMFMGMWTFGLIMCFGYIAFVPAKSLYSVLAKLRIISDADIPRWDLANAGENTPSERKSDTSTRALEQAFSSEAVVVVEPDIARRFQISESVKRIGLEAIPVAAWPEAVKVYHALQARTVICSASRHHPSELQYWTSELDRGRDNSDREIPSCIALLDEKDKFVGPELSSPLWHVPQPTEEELSALLDGHLPTYISQLDTESVLCREAATAVENTNSSPDGSQSERAAADVEPPLKFSLSKSE